MKNKGVLFVISGPSGSGKTTLAEKVLRLKGLRGKVRKSVSFTTRRKRPSEVHGKDYFFISAQAFLKNRREKKILEWTRYLEYYYGTPKEAVDQALAAGIHLVLCLDVRGAAAIKKAYPRQSVTIFVEPPAMEALRERIEKRCALSEAEVSRRLKQAEKEMKEAVHYRYRVVNDSLAQAVRQVKGIILSHIQSKA